MPEIEVTQNSAPINATPAEVKPKKTAKIVVAQKSKRNTDLAPADSPMDFENIAPATIAPSEPKKSNGQTAKSFVRHPGKPTS